MNCSHDISTRICKMELPLTSDILNDGIVTSKRWWLNAYSCQPFDLQSGQGLWFSLMYGIISGNIKILKKITKEMLWVGEPSVPMWVLTRGGKPTVKATWRLPTILWSTATRYQNTGSKTVETETETIKWQKMVAKICKKRGKRSKMVAKLL